MCIYRSNLDLRQRHEILSFVNLMPKTASADCYKMIYYECTIALLGMFAKFRKTAFLISVPPFVWNYSSPTGEIIMKFYIGGSFENLLIKSKIHIKLKRITGTLQEDPCAFIVIPRRILLRMRKVLHNSCRENQNTYFMFNNFFFRKSCRL